MRQEITQMHCRHVSYTSEVIQHSLFGSGHVESMSPINWPGTERKAIQYLKKYWLNLLKTWYMHKQSNFHI